jgi:hypothetical protein
MAPLVRTGSNRFIPGFAPFSGLGMALVFGGGTGASPSSINSSTVEQYSFATGVRTTGASPANGVAALGGPAPGGHPMCQGAAASNTTNAFVFGGGDVNLYNGYSGGTWSAGIDNYVFASLGTKGASPPALANGIQGRLAAASDKSANAFTFGGYVGAYNAGGFFDTVDWYLFNNLASKGVTPAVMAHGYQAPTACGNSVMCLLFPGYAGQTATLFSTEKYLFSTAVKTVLASHLSVAQFTMSSAGNEANAFVFGGGNPSIVAVDVVDVFSFASPGTIGTMPTISMASHRYYSSAASNSTSAFIFGGSPDASTNAIDTCESYQFASMATRGATPAALSSPRMATCAASNHQ